MKLSLHLEVLKLRFDILLISGESLTWWVLFGYFIDGLLHESFNFFHFPALFLQSLHGLHKVEEEEKYSIVVVVAGVSGNLPDSHDFILAEIIFQFLKIF